MKKRFTILLLCFIAFVYQQSYAQTSITVKNKGAYTAYYEVSYILYGVTKQHGEKSLIAGSENVEPIPAGATKIAIKTSFLSVFSRYDLTTINAGSSGGTFTFKGLLGGVNHTWEPLDPNAAGGTDVFLNVDQIYPNGDAELHRAARDANGSQMKMLIEKGTTKINTKNTRGFTPLHEAVQKGFGEGIDILLTGGADMNIQNSLGENPFIMSLGLGKKDVAKKFIDHGYPVASDAKALEVAVKKRNDEMVKLLLDNGADPNAVINLAMQQNNIPMVEMVMNNYTPNVTIDLYKKSVDGRRFDLAKRIIESGVDANQALDYAIQKNVPELVQPSLEKGGNAQKALKYAVSQRKADIAALAISNHGADANLVLEEAIISNQTDVVTMLLDNNADPNTGLTHAINNNKPNFITLMLDRGAKVNNQQIAKVAASGDNTLLPKLIEAGGNKDTALAASMRAKKFETAELLIQAGAKPDNIVKTAVETKQKNLLIAALDAGADPNPGLYYALANGIKDYADLLFKAGAVTNDPALIKIVIGKGDLSVLKMMIDNKTNPDLGIRAAVESNNTGATQMLLENGADAKPAALIATAAKNKNLQLVDMLMKGGANPQDGIVEAVKSGDPAITKHLLAAGADGRDTELLKASVPHNNAGLTGALIDAGANPAGAVDAAISFNANNILGLFISKGVDVKNPRYLALAIKNNNLPNVSLLIEAGCDMEYKDDQGNNYLHMAAAAEADAIVATLAKAGVKVNELNNAKEAPIHIAVVQGRKEVELVEAFLTAGADANVLNGSGKKPLDLAKGTRIKKRLKEAGGSKD